MTTPPPPEFPWAIVISAVGVAVNFLFNIINFLRTSALKHRDVRLDEFKRLRTSVLGVITELRADQQSLRALGRAGSAKAKWEAELKALNIKLADTYGKLDTVLSELNQSSYATGQDWQSLPAASWDRAVNEINGGYNQTKTRDQQKAALIATADHLDKMVETINARLNSELAKHAPPPK